jgi:hypothetical protein
VPALPRQARSRVDCGHQSPGVRATKEQRVATNLSVLSRVTLVMEARSVPGTIQLRSKDIVAGNALPGTRTVDWNSLAIRNQGFVYRYLTKFLS